MSSFEFLQYTYFGNSVQNYLIACGFFVFSIIVAIVLRFVIVGILRKYAKKTKNKLDDTLVIIMNKVFIAIVVLAGIYFALRALSIPENMWVLIEKGVQVAFIFKVFQGITILTDFVISAYLIKLLKLKKGFDIELSKMLTRTTNIVIWVIAASMILNLFGYDIGALVAGLGIGGLAIALAAQDPLSNFFSSLSIIADKPFKVEDVIKFGEIEGVIKDIGMRTTRIETFFGTIISVPNSTLAKASVENMSRRETRRADGRLGLVYHTSTTKLQKAVKIIKDIIKKEKNAEGDFRAFFTEFDDSSLRIEYTYYVKNPTDYGFFLETKDRVNRKIKSEFEKEGIEMAFPTQTLHIHKSDHETVSEKK
ncbi:mechanosensitive ion channel family protein [Patescibacteria group bacterium]